MIIAPYIAAVIAIIGAAYIVAAIAVMYWNIYNGR